VPSNAREGAALELALLGNAFVWLGGAFDAVLLLVAVGGKQAHHLIDAAAIAAAEQTGNHLNIVANAKLVRHDSLSVRLVIGFRHPNGPQRR